MKKFAKIYAIVLAVISALVMFVFTLQWVSEFVLRAFPHSAPLVVVFMIAGLLTLFIMIGSSDRVG
jgi:uncharacterized membrane protein